MALDKVPYTDGVTTIYADNLNDIQDAIIALEKGGAISDDLKQALLQIASKVAYIDDQGAAYYQDLYDALYPSASLVSISAAYTQSSTVYPSTQLDSLKTDLVVTGTYDDSSTATIPATDYTLSGTLTVGTSVITVTSGGKTTTFSVTVTAAPTLSSITALYTQSGTVYTTDTLDSLKDDLVVAAHYSDSSTQTVPAADYTLSGTLAEGTQTITVSYGGKTATFTVACTVNGWLYHFNQSLLSSGSEDFGLTGNAVYAAGRNGTDYAYSHIIPTSGDVTTDTQLGLKAVGLSKTPNFGGDFTISFWMATQINKYCHPYFQTIYIAGSAPPNGYFTGVTVNKNTWSADIAGANGRGHSGFAIQGSSSSGKLIFRFSNGDVTKTSQMALIYPADIDTTQWHHYALTRNGNTVRFFFDGELVVTATTSQTTVYDAGQVAVSALFGSTDAAKSDVQETGNGELLQDLYIAEFCKWESTFDPSSIVY